MMFVSGARSEMKVGHIFCKVGRAFSTSALETHLQMCFHQKQLVLKTVSPEDYAKTHKAPYHGSIGGHMRHSLDHFSKLLGVFSSEKVICYDDRIRSTDIESDIEAAKRRVDSIHLKLNEILSSGVCTDISVVVRFIGDCSTGATYDSESTFRRELSFVCHHATHHLFFCRMMMETMRYDINDLNIGIANSTILHHRK